MTARIHVSSMRRKEAGPVPNGIELLENDNRIAIQGSGLRLTFQQREGRWTHALALGEGALQRAASAIEADPAQPDPARVISPSYQEIHRHPDPRNVCLLLTGQSAAHHFSAVVSARTVDDSVVVVFDVADRCRSPVETLAATYLVAFGSSDLVAADPIRVVWGGDELGRGQLELVSDGGGRLALAEAGRRATHVQTVAEIDSTTHTQRLAYRWIWTPAPRIL